MMRPSALKGANSLGLVDWGLFVDSSTRMRFLGGSPSFVDASCGCATII